MSTEAKGPSLPSSSQRRRTTPVGLAKDQSKPPPFTNEAHQALLEEMRRRPAIKQYRAKPVTSQAARRRNTAPITKTPGPANVKTPTSERATASIKAHKTPTKKPSLTTPRSHPSGGRHDPYELSSDSDIDSTPGRNYSLSFVKRGTVMPAKKARRASPSSSKARKSMVPLSPDRAAAESPVCGTTSKRTEQKNSKKTSRNRVALGLTPSPEIAVDRAKLVQSENQGLALSSRILCLGSLIYSVGKGDPIHRYSEDEYKPPSLDDEPSAESSSDDQLTSHLSQHDTRLYVPENTQTSPTNSRRNLRNRSYTIPSISSTPTKDLDSKGEESPVVDESSNSELDEWNYDDNPAQWTRSSKDPTDTLAYYDDLIRKRRIIDWGNGKNKDGTQPVRLAERKWWWYLNGWLHRYDTTYDLDYESNNVSIGSGPYRGWIICGPGNRSHEPHYREPDDQILAEADKTEIRRWWHWHTYSTDSELDYDNWSDLESTDQGLEDGHGVDEASVAKAEAMTTEWAERVKRTAQYVLTGSLGDDIESQQAVEPLNPSSIEAQGSLGAKLAPTAACNDSKHPHFASSETTSTLIAQQLVTDQSDRSPPTTKPNQQAHSFSWDSTSNEQFPVPPAKTSSANTTSIVVELPGMTKEERAKYDAVSPIEETSSFIQHPKSFKEINESSPSQEDEPNSSDEETLQYIMYQSPHLLNTITEVDESTNSIYEKKVTREMMKRGTPEQPQRLENGWRTNLVDDNEVGDRSSPTDGQGQKRKASTDLSAADGSSIHKKVKSNGRRRRRNNKPGRRDRMDARRMIGF
ncbi:hypothetical protein F5Y04DRAFT_154223 [Hypomontagnella monticulosa]|nr:hypothetical protein F5Y04DRAFT_154223 [Hypomontagnella monticulosa]